MMSTGKQQAPQDGGSATEGVTLSGTMTAGGWNSGDTLLHGEGRRCKLSWKTAAKLSGKRTETYKIIHKVFGIIRFSSNGGTAFFGCTPCFFVLEKMS